MADKETKWTQFGSHHIFAERMRQAISGGPQLGSNIKMIQSIPTFAVKCLKCEKYHFFSELIKGCKNCSSTAYGIGGQPTQISIVCTGCGTELLSSVKCECGCMNPLNADTMNQPKVGGCFVVTAACENPYALEVVYLSRFRDEFLSSSRLGRAFIRIYYVASPRVAALISRYEVLQRFVLLLMVRPAFHIVKAMTQRDNDLTAKE